MHKCNWVAAIALFFTISIPTFSLGSPWGADYFPNVPLINQDGKTMRFFDDMIKDKIVVINFIYTTCPDSCPLETAQLIKVQRLLGDRLGDDIFFYSITIDPEVDTPAVLKEYREKFGARWTFLTGKDADITQLRRKLGLYIEEIQDGSNNHNVSMIIGNQATGRWMKRSPFENPHVLADQLANWLTGWKDAPKGEDYASAPELRSIDQGEQLFRTRCDICHTVTGKQIDGALGPDLFGVTQKREMTWLLNWLRAPDQMLKDKDPIAMALFKQYNNVAMPNMRLKKQEALDLIDYMRKETLRLQAESQKTAVKKPRKNKKVPYAETNDVVAIMNAWIKQAHPAVKANAGYMILINVGDKEVILDKIESEAFEKIEIHEMAHVNGLMKMRRITDLVIPVDGLAKFVPGGKHLMMHGSKQDLTKGQNVDLTLTFKSGIKQTVTVKVASK